MQKKKNASILIHFHLLILTQSEYALGLGSGRWKRDESLGAGGEHGVFLWLPCGFWVHMLMKLHQFGCPPHQAHLAQPTDEGDWPGDGT